MTRDVAMQDLYHVHGSQTHCNIESELAEEGWIDCSAHGHSSSNAWYCGISCVSIAKFSISGDHDR